MRGWRRRRGSEPGPPRRRARRGPGEGCPSAIGNGAESTSTICERCSSNDRNSRPAEPRASAAESEPEIKPARRCSVPTSRLRSMPRAWAIASLMTIFRSVDWGIGSDGAGPVSSSDSSDGFPATISTVSGPMAAQSRLGSTPNSAISSAARLSVSRVNAASRSIGSMESAPRRRATDSARARARSAPAVNDSSIREKTPCSLSRPRPDTRARRRASEVGRPSGSDRGKHGPRRLAILGSGDHHLSGLSQEPQSREFECHRSPSSGDRWPDSADGIFPPQVPH